MKCLAAVLVVFLLVLGISGCKKKQPESSVSDFQSTAPRTAPSAAQPVAPVLTPTSAKIGPACGTLNSSDGSYPSRFPRAHLPRKPKLQFSLPKTHPARVSVPSTN